MKGQDTVKAVIEEAEKSRHSIPTIVDVGNDAFKDGRKSGIKEVLGRIEPILLDRLCRSSLKPILVRAEIAKLKKERGIEND